MTTRSGRSPQAVAALAELLYEHVLTVGRLDAHLLHADALTALRDDPDVQVVLIDRTRLPAGCTVAAVYDPSTAPATLRVANDLSAGRRAFSALHEYAHHLRDQVEQVMLALLEQADAGRALEEDVCDAFAARVLAPPDIVERLLDGGVTAKGVQRLMDTLPASRQACAVAAAQHLPSPGYILLLEPDGTVAFAARHGDVPPIRPGTAQSDPLVVHASRTGTARGTARLSTGGISSAELLVDAAGGGRYTVLVAVTDSPAWPGLTVGRSARLHGRASRCEHCDAEFLSFTAPCPECGEPRCEQCGQCACPSAPPVRGARPCSGCRLTLPPAAFPGAAADRCEDCA